MLITHDRKPGLGKWVQDLIKLTLCGPTVSGISRIQDKGLFPKAQLQATVQQVINRFELT